VNSASHKNKTPLKKIALAGSDEGGNYTAPGQGPVLRCGEGFPGGEEYELGEGRGGDTNSSWRASHRQGEADDTARLQ
jgi:hypothetical protein